MTKITTLMIAATSLITVNAMADCGACAADKEAKAACGTAVHEHAEKDVQSLDIVDTAVKAGSFKTLAAALQAADLVDVLKGKGPFTVFAPTDAAFAKLPAGTVENLLKPENREMLKSVLTYHVVSGKVMSKDVVNLQSAKTVQGQKVKIAVKDGAVNVNNAKVVKVDIEATNGVIHVIDTVILPKQG